LEVGSLRNKIQELEDVKAAGQRLWARIRWNHLHNIVSKEFFSTIKSKPSKTSIFTLRDEDGNVVSREEDLEFVCCNFYKKLYQVKEETLEQIEMRAMVLESLPKKFSSELNARLHRPISMEELYLVTKSMVKNKSPSPDGRVLPFCCEVIREDVSQMI
jgi:hypothetical protein